MISQRERKSLLVNYSYCHVFISLINEQRLILKSIPVVDGCVMIARKDGRASSALTLTLLAAKL